MKSKAAAAAIACAIMISVVLMFPRYSYNDPDTFWHIELGRYMIDHQTILHHAIHTFYQDKLPYVPHEFGFQWIVAPLYQAFGWPGTYLLTAFCLFMLIMGLERLTRVSRKELGLPQRHPVLLLFVMLVAVWIYYGYFSTRPQMVSSWMIVWFFVYLREFQMRAASKYIVLMTLLSLGVANFHAGVWLVVAVFTGMAAVESAMARTLTWKRAAAFAAVLMAGLLNPGGLRSILFILTVTKDDFNMSINEWQPIAFAKMANLPILLLLLFFAASLPFTLHRKPFRYLLMLGIVFLGVSSFKTNLFMWLFIPYFAASLPEAVPFLRNVRWKYGARGWMVFLAAGLCLNIALNFAFPPKVDAKQYPVEEMNFILHQVPDGHRPKVMAPYGASGYVMFRGGDILCDGRQDPFVTDESKGVLGWNAFQRSIHGYGEYLPDIVRYDRPDYVIARSSVSWKLQQMWVKEFGEPVFKGKFGNVYAINRT